MKGLTFESGGTVVIMPPVPRHIDEGKDWDSYRFRTMEQLAYHFGDQLVTGRGAVASSDVLRIRQLADNIADNFDLQQEVIPPLDPWGWKRQTVFALRHVSRLIENHTTVVLISETPVCQELAVSLVHYVTGIPQVHPPDLTHPFDLLELDLSGLRQAGFRQWDFRRH